MTITVTEYIPADKMMQFHEILCSTGGRYIRNPLVLWDRVEVQYEPGDYKAHIEAWSTCVTPIREVRRDQWWRVILRRFWFGA